MIGIESVNLSYQTLERLSVRRPVDRLSWLAQSCAGKVVLDIGCYDETALAKQDTDHWLHGRLAKTAKRVITEHVERSINAFEAARTQLVEKLQLERIS